MSWVNLGILVRLMVLSGLILLTSGMSLAGTTGSDDVTIFSPTAFWYYPDAYAERMMPIKTALGYDITIYEVLKCTEPQGTDLADAVKELLGAGVGIFVKVCEHGYKQPNFMLIGFYDNIDNRDADFEVLDPNNLSFYTKVDEEDMWGIAMGWPTVREAFTNNGTVVCMDDCYSLGLISNGLPGAVGLGYSGEVGYHAAWDHAEIFWREWAKLTTVVTALGSEGCDLEITSGSDESFVLSNNLASAFHGARIQGDVLVFDATPLDTDHWDLLWSCDPTGPFEQFATVLPDSTGIHYEVSVPSEYTWVQIREIETDGNSLIQSTVRRNTRPAPDMASEVTDAELIEELQTLEAQRQLETSQMAIVPTPAGSDNILLTITVDPWADVVWENVNVYWRDWHGYETYLETIPEISSPPPPANRDVDRFYINSVIETYIELAASEGKTLLVHIIGNKNDYEMWTQPWPTAWMSRYNSYISAGYPVEGGPQNDFIPGAYDQEACLPEESTGFWTPWIPHDKCYSDRDGDGVSDIVVTRWSVNSVSEVLTRSYNMQYYNDHGFPAELDLQVLVAAGELEHGSGGDTSRVLRSVNSVSAVLPESHGLLLESTEPDPGARNLLLADWLNSGLNLLVMVADNSNPLYPSKQFWAAGASPAWNMGMLHSSQLPYCISVCCGSVNSSLTLHPDHPDPIVEQMGSAAGVGFVGMLGLDSGSTAYADEIITVQAVTDLFDETPNGLSMAEIALLTEQRVAESNGEDVAVMKAMRSLRFEGDPCSPFLRMYFTSGVSEFGAVPAKLSLAQNYPNPFNPKTSISFFLPNSGKVKLCIYDAAGHYVRTLVSGERDAGFHLVSWNGCDDSGQKVASGVYFYQLASNEMVCSKKMMLLK